MSARSSAFDAAHDRRAALHLVGDGLERILDGDGPAPARDPWSHREARLFAARALARVHASEESVVRVVAAIVRDQRQDGGFDGAHAGVAADAGTTALCVEILAARSPRTSAEENALARAIERLAAIQPSPAVARALASVGAHSGALDALSRAARELESEFETQALAPLADVREAADRLHAWHAAAARLSLDPRRHPAVMLCTLALTQRAESSAGEMRSSYSKDNRVLGKPADTLTSATAALALFAVHDLILSPRTAFAANLVVDALAPRNHGGILRAGAARFAPAAPVATALYHEALRTSVARAQVRWSLPSALGQGPDAAQQIHRGA